MANGIGRRSQTLPEGDKPLRAVERLQMVGARQEVRAHIGYVLSRACKGSLRSAAVDDLPIANQDGTGAPIRCSLSSMSTCRPRGGSASPIHARPRKIRP